VWDIQEQPATLVQALEVQDKKAAMVQLELHFMHKDL
jgi:hypothetical protein